MANSFLCIDQTIWYLNQLTSYIRTRQLHQLAKQLHYFVFLVKEISQKKLISSSIVAKWDKFGIHLGFDYGELSIIDGNATQLGVQECSEKMLKRWWDTERNPTVDLIIKALEAIDRKNDAHQLHLGQQLLASQQVLSMTVVATATATSLLWGFHKADQIVTQGSPFYCPMQLATFLHYP